MTLSQQIKPEFQAFVNTVLTRHNAEVLPDTVGLVDRLGAKLIVISNTTPEGAGEDAYEDLAVPLSDLRRILPAAARIEGRGTC